MTREEAIKIFNTVLFFGKCDCPKEEIEECLKMAIKALEQKPTTKNDLALIHTEGLDEEIRCTMCTNSMKSNRGCDGSCVVNNAMYKKIMDVIKSHIAELSSVIPQEPKTGHWSHDGSHWKNRFVCSECGYKLFDEPTNFCPNCGAKMIEPQESEE